MFSRTFRPSKTPSRRQRPRQNYSFVPANEPSDSDVDIEKRPSTSDEDDWESDTSSSPHASNINASTPLRRKSSRRLSNPLVQVRHIPAGSKRQRRIVRRYGQFFSICLGLSLVLLGVTLWQQSARSAREVGKGFQNMQLSHNAWEEFSLLKRYYGGLKSLVAREENKPEYPDRAAEEEEVKDLTESRGKDGEKEKSVADKRSAKNMVVLDPYGKDSARVKCFLDAEGSVGIPALSVYSGVVEGMPDPAMGSYDVLRIKNDFCFDRFGRLGPYGLGYSQKKGGSGAGLDGDREGVEEVWSDVPAVDWRNVKWAEAQETCLQKNKHRFEDKDFKTKTDAAAIGIHSPKPTNATTVKANESLVDRSQEDSASSTKLPRTAVLIRTWHDYEYDAEDLFYLRALVAELSINSGGEYTVHFLIHVKDDNLQIWADDATHQKVLNDSLPAEFAGMGSLWSERQMGLVYGGLADSMYRELPVHGVYRSAFMPVQWYAHQHPEFDHFWHWEMDVRYIGHYYELVEKVSKWAKEQPRKELWERNARFYIPSEHGSWDDFKHMVRVQTEHGTSKSWPDNGAKAWEKLGNSNPDSPDSVKSQSQQRQGNSVWGPDNSLEPSDIFEPEANPKIPHPFADDKYTWGVGEDADLIVFNPIFDPQGTNWILAADTTGYNTSSSPHPPRCSTIGTTGRYSRRLLETMHRETALARHTMFSEMWPATTALHHGLKAVYAPHPVYIDRRWPTSYLAAIFNNGRNGATGGARKSVFSDEQQHNLRGTTWYYNAEFAARLWKRWLGYMVDEEGGEEAELNGEGRMCLPSLLVHPVKHVDLVWEHGEWDEAAAHEEKVKGHAEKKAEAEAVEGKNVDAMGKIGAEEVLPEN